MSGNLLKKEVVRPKPVGSVASTAEAGALFGPASIEDVAVAQARPDFFNAASEIRREQHQRRL